MQPKTWHSITADFMDRVVHHTNRSPMRLITTLNYVLRRTNRHATTIRWDKDKRILGPGSSFFTLTELAELIEVKHPTTARGYLEDLKDYFDFDFITSRHNKNGGVILTWDNWEEIQKPWEAFSVSDCKVTAESLQSENAATKGFCTVQEKHSAERLQPSNKQYINTNTINSLSLSGDVQNINTQELRESERELIDLFKNVFSLPVPKSHIEKFCDKFRSENWDKEILKSWMKELASDKLLKSLIWSINGIFHYSHRIQDLEKTKCVVPAILESLNESALAHAEIEFEALILNAFNELTEYVKKFPGRVKFRWSLADFKDYFSGSISLARKGFQDNQAKFSACSTMHAEQDFQPHLSESEDQVFPAVEIQAQSDIPFCNQDIEALPLEFSREAIVECEKTLEGDLEKHKDLDSKGLEGAYDTAEEAIRGAKNETELDRIIKEIASNHDVPRDLASESEIRSRFSEVIAETANKQNIQARKRYQARLETAEKDFIGQGLAQAVKGKVKLTIPFPSFEATPRVAEGGK